jgi:hypothetical protein
MRILLWLSRGRAKAAWDAYARGVNKLVDPLLGNGVQGLAKRVGAAYVGCRLRRVGLERRSSDTTPP